MSPAALQQKPAHKWWRSVHPVHIESAPNARPDGLLARPANDKPTDALAGAAGGLEAQSQNEQTNCTGQAAADQATAIEADEKRFATLRARLALCGWVLSRSDAADSPVVYAATRWNKPRELASLAAVAAFADHVGAPA